MKQMKMGSMPGDPCKMIPRPKQPCPNPAPGATPESIAATKKALDERNSALKKGVALFQKATSVQPRPTPTQSSNALADRRDQERKLKGEY